MLALTDILIVNEGEGRAISGHAEPLAIGETLARRAGRAAVVTLGARGAMLFEPGQPVFALAPPAVEVIDTTGAGDAFTGAFAARWAVDHDAAAALAWGVAAGALACTARGAAISCPDRKSDRSAGGCSRARTCDPLIKSQLLYLLSYAPAAAAAGRAGPPREGAEHTQKSRGARRKARARNGRSGSPCRRRRLAIRLASRSGFV